MNEINVELEIIVDLEDTEKEILFSIIYRKILFLCNLAALDDMKRMYKLHISSLCIILLTFQ